MITINDIRNVILTRHRLHGLDLNEEFNRGYSQLKNDKGGSPKFWYHPYEPFLIAPIVPPPEDRFEYNLIFGNDWSCERILIAGTSFYQSPRVAASFPEGISLVQASSDRELDEIIQNILAQENSSGSSGVSRPEVLFGKFNTPREPVSDVPRFYTITDEAVLIPAAIRKVVSAQDLLFDNVYSRELN